MTAQTVEDQVTPEWMLSAACADVALGSARTRARIFHPSPVGLTHLTESAVWSEAKAVCRRCPVSAECLAHAIEHGESDGVWGGLDPNERRLETRRIRRRRNP